MWHLKAFIEDACLASVERLFQNFAPLSEKHFCSLAELFKASLKSIFVFRSLRAVLKAVTNAEFSLAHCNSDFKTLTMLTLTIGKTKLFIYKKLDCHMP